jgi:transposase
MARKASGQNILGVAKAYLSKAKTAEALRQAQAVVFPLLYGMSLEKTAEAIGVSSGWACQLRNRFIKEGKVIEIDKALRGGRRRENMTIEEEKEFLLPFFDKAKSGGILIVNDIKNAMDRRLGRQVALASAYNLLHRHGWRKLAPDKRHPQSDVKIQEAWKKNSLKPLPKSTKHGQGKDGSD